MVSSDVEDEAAAAAERAPLVGNGSTDVRRRRDQAKAILSKQNVKIATKALPCPAQPHTPPPFPAKRRPTPPCRARRRFPCEPCLQVGSPKQ